MARLMRECLVPWSQQEGAGEPETDVSVPQQGKQANVARGKDIADYDWKVDTNQRDQTAISKQ